MLISPQQCFFSCVPAIHNAVPVLGKLTQEEQMFEISLTTWQDPVSKKQTKKIHNINSEKFFTSITFTCHYCISDHTLLSRSVLQLTDPQLGKTVDGSSFSMANITTSSSMGTRQQNIVSAFLPYALQPLSVISSGVGSFYLVLVVIRVLWAS